ncbi:hypothetical protein SAMN05443248_0654 [Bradyrhizobium erythrophlei]|jgi:hypothetical protein|uniref:Uncharacterized protein n=2 Tax=Bradyrhizobium erythrophlei TaxID=1437360 RepID=A0A1M5HV82_9BRAD|nr:hypothetical protein SAMN05443248_0654 [Bradyrhizobium erythrophlei]
MLGSRRDQDVCPRAGVSIFGSQMSAEWRKSPSGHTFDADVLRLDTFYYQDAWRWCVTDTSDVVVAQGVADDKEDAKAKAVAWARERLTTALRQLP